MASWCKVDKVGIQLDGLPAAECLAAGAEW